MGGAPTLAVQTLEAELGLKSLLTRQAGIKRLVLSRPVIELRVDAQGRRSWDFALASPRQSQAALAAASGDERPLLIPVSAPAQAQPAADAGSLAATLEMLSPASVRIVEGSVRYVDERSGLRHDVTALDLDLALDAGAGPLQAKGSFAWRGEKVAVDGNLSSLRALVEERRARLSLKLAGQPIEASYDGTLDVVAGVALDGNVSLKSPSVQALGSWTGSKPIAAGRDAGALALSELADRRQRPRIAGRPDGDAGRHPDQRRSGDRDQGGAALRQRHPQAFPARSRRHPDSPDLGRAGSARSVEASAPSGSNQADPIDDILRRNTGPAPAPQVRGFTKRAGGGADWSDDVIDLAPLGLADADLALSADRARLQGREDRPGPARAAR